MFYFKRSLKVALITMALSPLTQAEEVSKTEIEALKGTHTQFEQQYDQDKGMYGSYAEMQKAMTIPPTEVKYPATKTFTQEDAKMFREQNKYAEKLAEQIKDEPEWINQKDGWQDITKEVAETSDNRVQKRMKMLYPELKDKEFEIPTINADNSGPLRQGENLYFFVSSSIPHKQLYQVMQVAKESKGIVVLKGMLPETVNIMQTSMWIQALMKEFGDEKPPKVVIDPRLFAVFNITGAPSMVYVRGDHEVVISGTATPQWLIEKGRASTGYNDLGNLSTTYPIVEEDMIAMLQRKYEQIDWNKQKEIAKTNFFKRQTTHKFPVAEEDNYNEIDPRIIFIKDVRASDGKLMAKKGDVVNPLQNFNGQNRTLFIIDPRDERQKELLKDRLRKEGVGTPIVIVSHLDSKKQFKGIAELQEEFQHQIYMLQPAYIERFRIKHLPVRIDIVGGKGMWVQEYGTETLNHYKKGI